MDIKCKICGNSKVKFAGKPVIYHDFPRSSQRNYKIFKCTKCKYFFILPEIDLTREEWKILYENDYFAESNVTSWQKKLHEIERKKRLKYILAKLEIDKGKFLDMGCGEGFVLKEAYDNGFESYGVDIAYNISIANSKFRFFQGDIFEANFPDNYFSVIYMDSVLEHLLNPMETLHELKRILQPGGILFLIVPNELSLYNFILGKLCKLFLKSHKYGKIRPFISPYHVNGFNPKSLKLALSISEFRKIEIKTFGGNYMFWKACKFGTRQYFQHLMFYPIGLLSIILNNQIQCISLSIK